MLPKIQDPDPSSAEIHVPSYLWVNANISSV